MSKTPAYRQRSGYDQAIVTLTDARSGKRRDYWLGTFNTPESRERYHRLIAEWESNGRELPTPTTGPAKTDRSAATVGPVVTDVVRAYWRFAKEYYRPNEYGTLRVALRLLRAFYGTEAAAEFGPAKLRLLREAMLRGDQTAIPPRAPWSRVYINQQIRRVRQMFRWAASHEVLSSEVHTALATVEPLKRGRCTAREGRRVMPVPRDIVAATRPYLSRQVVALVDLQLLTAARGGELLGLRSIDIDTADATGVWAFRPREHKNLYRGKERVIYFGPAAQAVLRPFMASRPVDAYLFSPAEAETERRAALSSRRVTPLCCGNRPGSNVSQSPHRTPGDRYTAAAYYTAIMRACDQAFPPPAHLRRREISSGRLETIGHWQARLSEEQREELGQWRKSHRWHPHQLRHTAATEIRRQFGLEAAQLVLGHSSAAITDAVYAERDAARVADVLRKVG